MFSNIQKQHLFLRNIRRNMTIGTTVAFETGKSQKKNYSSESFQLKVLSLQCVSCVWKEWFVNKKKEILRRNPSNVRWIHGHRRSDSATSSFHHFHSRFKMSTSSSDPTVCIINSTLPKYQVTTTEPSAVIHRFQPNIFLCSSGSSCCTNKGIIACCQNDVSFTQVWVPV